jgi:hypothetical protein
MKISARNMLNMQMLRITHESEHCPASLTRFAILIHVPVKMHFLELFTSAYATEVNKNVKLSLKQAVETHILVRRQGCHII